MKLTNNYNLQYYSIMTIRLIKIFFISLKIGAFTFGGGYAMIPVFQNEYSVKRNWISEKDIADIFALAQSLPGVLAVNSSMLIGFKSARLLGAFAAVLGIVLPSLAAMSFVALFYTSFAANTYVVGALRGMSAAVAALMLSAVFNLRKQAVSGAMGLMLAASTLAVCFLLPNLSAIWLILAGGIVGLALMSFPKKERQK